MENSQIVKMGYAIQKFLEEETMSDAKPKDLMPILIENGFFKKDHRDGLPLREVLRALNATGRLGLIPQVRGEIKGSNIFWFFNPSKAAPYFINTSTIYEFHNLIKDDPYNRYNSWQHCFEIFENIDNLDNEYLALHLGFYLASWGMYRGSTGLLQKDYKIHIGAVEIIRRYFDLRCNGNKEVHLEDVPRIMSLKNELYIFYNQFEYLNNSNEFKRKPPTDVLLSKIIMGTLGCTPAFDNYFNRGVGKVFSFTKFNEERLQELFNFIQRFDDQLKELQQFFIKEKNSHYPIMKIVDMYFWQKGYMNNKK